MYRWAQLIRLLSFSLLLAAFHPIGAYADSIKIIETDDEALAVRLDLIRSAKREILVEYFEAQKDDVTLKALAALREAARRGVKVKIMIDDYHNGIPMDLMANLLMDAKDSRGQQNLEIRVFNPFNILNFLSVTFRNHDKMFNVDGEYVILGSRNASDNYYGLDNDPKSNFKDIDVVVDGKTAQQTRQYFLTLWDKKDIVKRPNLGFYHPRHIDIRDCRMRDKGEDQCERDVRYRLSRIERAARKLDHHYELLRDMRIYQRSTNWRREMAYVGSNAIEFMHNSPLKNVGVRHTQMADQLYAYMTEQVRSGGRIVIVTPYLFPSKRALQIWRDLIQRRKIKLTIITNSIMTTDVFLAHAAYESIREDLVKMGIELYEYHGPGVLHAKAMVLDDHHGFVGSFNFDRRSEYINREIGIFVEDNGGHEFTDNLMRMMNGFKKQSRRVGYQGQLLETEHIPRSDSERHELLRRKHKVNKAKILLPLVEDHI